MIKHTVRMASAALFVASLFSAPAMAQELTGTLKKIKETGTISLGHRESSIPFSWLFGVFLRRNGVTDIAEMRYLPGFTKTLAGTAYGSSHPDEDFGA